MMMVPKVGSQIVGLGRGGGDGEPGSNAGGVMQRTMGTVVLAVMLVIGIAPHHAAAADAQVRYIITNGGQDVGEHGQVHYLPAGHHDGSEIAWASSGDPVRIPAGHYDVRVNFDDGSAHIAVWIDNQSFSGTVSKTVEIGLPITEVRYHITNGGHDVGENGQVHYLSAGHHDGSEVAWAGSGDPVRIPAGHYDVRVNFDDGSAHKAVWIDNQNFSGKVDRTVEIGLPMAEVSYQITNGGHDVGEHGQVHYLPAGHHDGSEVAWAGSGASVRIPAGHYDVRVNFDDGSAQKVVWIDNQSFSGKVEKSIEVGVAVTEVRYIITNGGHDVGEHGQVHYLPAGHHDGSEVAWAGSGASVRIPAGHYDVRVNFDDGSAQKVVWIDNQSFSGKVEKSIEVGVAVTEVRYIITNGGHDVGEHGQVHYLPAGHHDASEVAWAGSGDPVRIPAGHYDVRVNFDDGSAHKFVWIDNQSFSGTVSKTVEIGLPMAEVRYRITNGGYDVGENGQVHYLPAGHHDASEVAWADSGGPVRLAAGSYDVRVQFRRGFASKEMWLDNLVFTGKVDKTVDLGLTLAEPRVTVTKNGADVGDKADVTYVDPAENYELGTLRSSHAALVEAGTYDIRARMKGAEAWLRRVAISGQPRLVIELQQPKTELTVTARRDGRPLSAAWCGVYPLGGGGSAPLGQANSGISQEVIPAAYDVGCFLDEAGITESAWLKNQTLKPGKTRLTIDLPSELASLTVTAKRVGAKAGAGGGSGSNLEIILDASGSMVSHVDKTSTRMQVAKSVLSDVIGKLPDKGVNVALRIYGTRPKAAHDCRDSRLVVPLGPVNKAALANAVAGVTPSGWTPIAVNLSAAAKDLPKGGTNALVLITDGLESCGGDPCAVAARLASQGVVTRSFVVGFTLGREHERLLRCIGHYYKADDKAQLSAALSEIVKQSLAPPTGTVTVVAADGKLAAEGDLGERLSLHRGRYDIRIAAGGKVRIWKGLQVKGNMVAPLADNPP